MHGATIKIDKNYAPTILWTVVIWSNSEDIQWASISHPPHRLSVWHELACFITCRFYICIKIPEHLVSFMTPVIFIVHFISYISSCFISFFFSLRSKPNSVLCFIFLSLKFQTCSHHSNTAIWNRDMKARNLHNLSRIRTYFIMRAPDRNSKHSLLGASGVKKVKRNQLNRLIDNLVFSVFENFTPFFLSTYRE